MKRYYFLLLFPCLLLAPVRTLLAEPETSLKQQPARITSYANEEMILGATHADKRLITVGDHGTILLSDDDGKTFRQAKSVPTRATLNSVSFANKSIGWAAGHWGTILKTTDGGETWILQRTDTSTDRPLFAVHAIDAGHAVAVGLWSFVLTTADGGAQWGNVKLSLPPDGGKADRNLFGLFSNSGILYASAERGLILRSNDNGNTWSYLSTGYKGTFWAGIALSDGTLLVGGLRGTVFRSSDAGKTWQQVDSHGKSSITAFSASGNSIVAVGLDGVVLQSTDGGLTFTASQREDRTALTAVVSTAAGAVLFSKGGVVSNSASTIQTQ